MKMKIQFLKAGKWQDKPWEPQFTVVKDDVRVVSAELGSVILNCKAGKLYEEDETETTVDSTDDQVDDDQGTDADGENQDPGEINISDLGLAESLTKKLQDNGLKTVADLLEKTEQDILDMDGIGNAKVEDIEEALAELGFNLKEA